VPAYDFLDVKSGATIELVMPMADVPDIGDDIEHEIDGETRVLRHLPPKRVNVSTERFKPHVSTSLPLGDPAHKAAGGKFTAMGEPIMETKADVDRRIEVAQDTPGAMKTVWD